MPLVTKGGWTRRVGPKGYYEPWKNESAGMDGFYKSEAYPLWEQAAAAYNAADAAFNSVKDKFDDGARNDWAYKLAEKSKRFFSEWGKVKGYSHAWTSWGKYIDQANIWISQFRLYSNEVKLAAGQSINPETKKSGKKPKKKQSNIIERRVARAKTRGLLAVSGGNTEAVAATLGSKGDESIPPAKADDTLLYVAGGALALAILWTMVPEESKPALPSFSTAGLGRRPRRRRY